MPLFNYQEKMIGIPDAWKQTNGAGVKIAILDTGATLTAAGMQHLDVSGRKFDITLPAFDAQTATGNDPVPDTTFGSKKHGTQLLSMLGANSPSDVGVRGMAPDAEIYILKIADEFGDIYIHNFLFALELCVKLDVDIVSNSCFPDIDDVSLLSEIDDQLDLLTAKNTLFITALKNRRTHTALNDLTSMPLDYGSGILSGVALDSMVDGLPEDYKFDSKISFLIPQVEVCQYTHKDNSTGATTQMTSSHSSALLSGLIALCLSEKRASDSTFKRFSRAEAIAQINGITPTFSKQSIQTKTFQFFKNTQNIV